MSLLKKTFLQAAFIFFFFSNSICFADINLTFSDTNFVNTVKNISGELRPYDFNRFRTELNAQAPSENIRFKGILDVETFIGQDFLDSSVYNLIQDPDPALPFNPYLDVLESDDVTTRLYLYRMWTEFKFNNANLVFGLQRIPFGVGRVWNPADTFNPINATSVESNERLGVFATRYTHYLTDLSFLEVLVNFVNDMDLDRYALRYKGHHKGMDMGISYVQNSDFLMSAVEWESNLLETGIEVRSEIGIFNNNALDEKYVSGIMGLEYGFPNNLTALAEYFYNGLGTSDKEDYDTGILTCGNWNLGKHYVGGQMTYELSPLIMLSLASIYNLGDESFFHGPSIRYSVNDETTFSIGANIFTGTNSSEFGESFSNLYYVKLETYF